MPIAYLHRVLKHSERREGVLVPWRERERGSLFFHRVPKHSERRGVVLVCLRFERGSLLFHRVPNHSERRGGVLVCLCFGMPIAYLLMLMQMHLLYGLGYFIFIDECFKLTSLNLSIP
ncbi:hypothetical protein TSAR_010170 [Trichomalopsis sarcophagae]|uniref:Uncharacterized protein n=1 Tax=Trichomalopsis sarcophagae TaxID=543379 RepID=A0A232ESE7_9HYME|nr:hypothetical protein TSAR_010170 [Trichomalopsis sarcophagae]